MGFGKKGDIVMAVRGKKRPLFKPFPKPVTPKWERQQLFIKLSNQRQDEREPYLFGDARSLYGAAKYSSR